MNALLEFTMSVVEDGVVPVLLGGGVLTGFLAAGRVAPGARVAAYAGSWAGVLLTAGWAIALGQGLDALRLPSVVGLVGLPVGLIGTGLFWMVRQSRSVGVLCLVQVFGALASLLNYYTVPGLHGFSAVLALSDALGTALLFLIPRQVTDWLAVREVDRGIYYRWRAERRRDRLPRQRRARRDRWANGHDRRRRVLDRLLPWRWGRR